MKFLLLALGLSMLFAGWQWGRPYDWHPDPAARYRITTVALQRDHSYFWLNVFLKRHGDESHDLTKPVKLITADGKEFEPADTALGGSGNTGIQDLEFRFYLQEEDFQGPLQIQLNDGRLIVRSKSGLPGITGDSRFFNTSNW